MAPLFGRRKPDPELRPTVRRPLRQLRLPRLRRRRDQRCRPPLLRSPLPALRARDPRSRRRATRRALAARNRRDVSKGLLQLKAFTLYSKDNCQPCRATKRKAAALGLTYDEINVDHNPEAAELLRADGWKESPVILPNDPFVYAWSGYDPDKLTAYAEVWKRFDE